MRSQFIYEQCRNVNWNIADNKKGQRNMRLIKVTGGLGNQMFIYAFICEWKVLSQSAYRPFGHDAL